MLSVRSAKKEILSTRDVILLMRVGKCLESYMVFLIIFIFIIYLYISITNIDLKEIKTPHPPFLNLHKGMWQKYLHNTSLLLGRNQRTQSRRHFFPTWSSQK